MKPCLDLDNPPSLLRNYELQVTNVLTNIYEVGICGNAFIHTCQANQGCYSTNKFRIKNSAILIKRKYFRNKIMLRLIPRLCNHTASYDDKNFVLVVVAYFLYVRCSSMQCSQMTS